MKLEDYFKYYIQGSDHYLIPKDIFEELFNEMNNWKEENRQLKKERNAMACLVNDLQETLEEIREYVKETLELKEEYPEEVECVVNDLLQIIDKAKESDVK